jgi:CBS domain-containing protein/anti-sigma regulatory factor (Ser/Thr protein kinase)
MTSLQEIYGRRGRTLTDQNAGEISRVEELAYDLRVEDVMSREVQSVGPDSPMREVLNLLRTKHISGMPVTAGANLIGVISLEDMMRCLQDQALDAPVKKYMTASPITIKKSEAVIEAIKVLSTRSIGRLPVLDDDKQLCGMITKGDITRGTLIALEKDYKEEEVRRYRASHLFEDIFSHRTSLILRYNIKAGDFNNGGQASTHIKRAVLRLGANAQIARRLSIAVYEAEMNLIIHTTNGGYLRVEIEPQVIHITVKDDGPGIPDVNKALQVGYSTATDEVRAMGFGAGMGLVNINRCVDTMTLESTVGKGTLLRMKIYLE